MKRLLVPLFLAALSMFAVSCDEDDQGGSEGSTYVLSDTRLVGHWLINRYDAFDNEGKLVNTTENESHIKTGYWRIDMTADCSMFLWYGEYSQAAVATTFFYDATLKMLYFGDTGEMEVVTLNDTSFVFKSDNIMPLDWYEKLYNGEYKYVTTVCKKENN